MRPIQWYGCFSPTEFINRLKTIYLLARFCTQCLDIYSKKKLYYRRYSTVIDVFTCKLFCIYLSTKHMEIIILRHFTFVQYTLFVLSLQDTLIKVGANK